jgi:hypothetical protein
MEGSIGSDRIYFDSSAPLGIIALDDTEIDLLLVDNPNDLSNFESAFQTLNFPHIPIGERSHRTGLQFGHEDVSFSPDNVHQHAQETSDNAMTSRRVRRPRE